MNFDIIVGPYYHILPVTFVHIVILVLQQWEVFLLVRILKSFSIHIETFQRKLQMKKPRYVVFQLLMMVAQPFHSNKGDVQEVYGIQM